MEQRIHEEKRLQKIITHNKFINDLQFNERARNNAVLEVVLLAKFNKTDFWKIVKERGLVEDDVFLVESILTTHNIILEEAKND